jgi:hypothetical protein
LVLNELVLEDEKARHGSEPSDEEVREGLRVLFGGFRDRVTLWIHGSALIAASRAHERAAAASVRASAGRAEAALAPAQRGALREIWARHRL